MYTEDDLRTTLAALEQEAPSAAGVMAGLERLRRQRTVRRRAVGMAAAAALVAVVAAGSALVASPDRDVETATRTNTEAGPFEIPFAIDELPGYQVESYRFDGDRSAEVQVTTPANIAAGFPEASYSVRVFRQGVFDASAAASGVPLEVGGKPGFYREDMPCLCESGAAGPAVGWEYAPDSWALVQYPDSGRPDTEVPADVRETLTSMATAVRFDRTTAVPLPFRIDHLPAGLRPSSSMETVVRVIRDVSFAHLELDGPDGRSMTFDVPSGAIFPVGASSDPHYPLGVPVVDTSVTPPRAVVRLEQLYVAVSGTGYGVEELKKVAGSTVFLGNDGDPAAWPAAADVFRVR